MLDFSSLEWIFYFSNFYYICSPTNPSNFQNRLVCHSTSLALILSILSKRKARQCYLGLVSRSYTINQQIQSMWAPKNQFTGRSLQYPFYTKKCSGEFVRSKLFVYEGSGFRLTRVRLECWKNTKCLALRITKALILKLWCLQ